jgi:hypothetical protein
MANSGPEAFDAAARTALLRREAAFALIVCSTVLGIAGTDLVLPAVPTLPAVLGGDLERAQLVLAAFVAGSACGLLGFGALGSRFDQRGVLCASLFGYGLISAAASLSPSLDVLIALRASGCAGHPASTAPWSRPAVMTPAAPRWWWWRSWRARRQAPRWSRRSSGKGSSHWHSLASRCAERRSGCCAGSPARAGLSPATATSGARPPPP